MLSRTNFSQRFFTVNNLRISIVSAAAVATTVAFAGCAMNMGTPSNSMMDAGHNSSMMGTSNTNEFSTVDIMFAQTMTAHHQQAVEMSDLALATSTNLDVRALAQKIRDAQAPEITLMKSWLDKAGSSTTMGHSMEDMGQGMAGMMTDTEMTALKNATGANFDALFLKGMIAHHEGAIQMATMVTNSTNPDVKNLAEVIVSSQSAEIAEMKMMLAK